MPTTPATPSPHRFRPSRDSRPSQKPPSSLRREVPPPPSPRTPAVATRNHVPASQFKPTPRFSASTRRSGVGDLTSTQSTRNVAPGTQQFVPRLNWGDSIEDSSPPDGPSEEQGDDEEEMLFDSESHAVVESVESRDASTANAYAQGTASSQALQPNAHFVDENPPKRRRLSPRAETSQASSIGAVDREQPTPWPPAHRDLKDKPDPSPMDPPATLPNPASPPRTARTSRFKHSSAASERAYSADPVAADPSLPPPSTTTTTSSRPRNLFRLPPTSKHSSVGFSDAADATPLPEAFSPHRRNQKFVQGGMAETVRSWILGIGHGHGATRKPQSPRLVVAESKEAVGANANRWRLLAGTAVVGEDDEGDDKGKKVRALLVGQDQTRGQRASLREGDEVRVAAPCWDVEVTSGSGSERERQSWVVGVDWSIV